MLLIITCVILVFLLSFVGYYFYVTKSVQLSSNKLLSRTANVTVFDNFDNILASTDADGKRLTNTTVLPQHVKYAFVDTEDKHFYRHNGYDYPRIIKAFFKNLSSHSFKQGASTISQQLIKNTHLTHEKTLTRKLQEWKLTRQLERNYTKDEILQNYLSVIYFGHNCFGLRSASTFYFDKMPEALTLGEACILAGLVKSPNRYSPFKNPERCQQRRCAVLACMLRNGHIDKEQKLQAENEPLPTTPHHTNEAYGYTHQAFNELEELLERYNLTISGDINIYTYHDKIVQQTVEMIAKNQTSTDKTIAVIDTNTCGYKAYVSTANEMRRSPASLLKPLLVYAPAIEENIVSPATPILDEKVNFSGYCPQNYDDKYHGYVSARESLAKSLNIPAVKTLNALGISKATPYLEKLQLNVEKEDCTLALALGGMKHGFSAKKLFSAYTVFPNNGNYKPSAFIKQITVNGETVYQNSNKYTTVFSPETSFLTSDMLRSAVEIGTAKKLRSLSCPIYAKTGTAGNKQGNTDAYGVAFTSQDVIGVWLGNANYSTISHVGGGEPCNIIAKIQERMIEDYQNKGISLQTLQPPNGVISTQLDKQQYEQYHELCLADPLSPAQQRFNEWFKQDNLPQKTCNTFSSPNILTPSISIVETGIKIAFANEPFYRYKIKRYQGRNAVLLYDGEYIQEFIDTTAKENEKYVYSVTPYYQKQIGKEVILPTIITPNTPFIKKGEKEILDKNWWEE